MYLSVVIGFIYAHSLVLREICAHKFEIKMKKFNPQIKLT